MSKIINVATCLSLIIGTSCAIAIPEASIAAPQIAQGQLTAEMFNNVGLKLMEQKKYPEAIEAFTKSLQYFPQNNADAYFYRAQAYIQIDRLKESLLDLTAALDTDPQHVPARFTRGILFCTISQGMKDASARKSGIELGQSDLDIAIAILEKSRNSRAMETIERLKKERNSCGIA